MTPSESRRPESRRSGTGRSSTAAPLPEPEARLVREWAVCGIVASVARFVPVPLMDDVVKQRATRIAVARTLAAHGRHYEAQDVEVLYGGTEGFFAGVAHYVAGVPTRVVLFPVRKYVAVLGSVKGVPTDVMEVILLARTVHRALAAGMLPDGDERARKSDARAVRRAFEKAFDESDLSLLRSALGQGLSIGRDMATSAVDRARELLGRGEDDDVVPEAGALDGGADEVERALDRSDVRAEIDRFDARVQQLLERRR